MPRQGMEQATISFPMGINLTGFNLIRPHSPLWKKGLQVIPDRIQPHKTTLTSMEGRVYRLYLTGFNLIRPRSPLWKKGLQVIPDRIQPHKATLTSMEGRVYRLYLKGFHQTTYTSIKGNFYRIYMTECIYRS